jgi:hypothetical protein
MPDETPAITPAEADAMKAEVERLTADNARLVDENGLIRGLLRHARRELDAIRAELERLKDDQD